MLLNEMLLIDRIKVNVEAKGWEEAIDIGGNLLIDQALIEKSYIEAVKQTLRSLGPYIVLAPGIAISHSRPENGVHKTCMSLIQLKEPVEFGHDTNDPVKVIFTLATTDKEAHLQSLRQLMSLMMVSEDLEVLFTAKDVDDIIEVINKHS
ncbi:MAG: PTS mannitol transporter subunit IIA [Firmicutes bacterium HGW-Firmicutes-7]|nr:MAG: PTS mannitol transporter subunit IIA [Firmicutes bacterium HGW-Firmicutes-7]